MSINRDNLFVQYVYSFARNGVPAQATLCSFFWTFVFTTLMWAMIFGIAGAVLYAFISQWKMTLAIIVVVIAIIGAWGVWEMLDPRLARIPWLATLKGKVCPRIEFD